VRVLLEAPTDLPLVQWQIAPLDIVDRRLAGCVWQLVGCLVPLTDERPDYPFLQYQSPPTRLQVWLWRVFRPPQKFCGELRWHPEKGRSAAIIGLSPGDGRAEVLRAWQWLNTSEPFSGGRPLGSGILSDDATAVQVIFEVALHLAAIDRKHLTRKRVAAFLNQKLQDDLPSATQLLRHNLSVENYIYRKLKSQNLTWAMLVERVLAALKK
jgi:hypothetical protein